jgi:hypothetical protein
MRAIGPALPRLLARRIKTKYDVRVTDSCVDWHADDQRLQRTLSTSPNWFPGNSFARKRNRIIRDLYRSHLVRCALLRDVRIPDSPRDETRSGFRETKFLGGCTPIYSRRVPFPPHTHQLDLA